MKRPTGKRRTREHIISDLSVNHVERHVLLCGYTVQRVTQDYGIDLLIATFNRKGEVEVGEILVQLKGTRKLRFRNDAMVSCRIERAHLVHWLAHPLPVILIVFDAAKELAYWLYVQSYFGNLAHFNLFAAGESITVHLPISHVVNKSAIVKFARFRDRVLEQMSEVIHDENDSDSVR